MMSGKELGTILENEMHQNIGSLNNVIDKVLIHYDENFLEILELILYIQKWLLNSKFAKFKGHNNISINKTQTRFFI